jgi:hypothetical protein
MTLRINNSPSVIEPIVIALIAVGSITTATYMALKVTVDRPADSPIFWAITIMSILVTVLVIRRTSKTNGTLSIDVENKLFTLNANQKMLNFSDLVYYKSTLVKPPLFNFDSRMVIKIGLSSKESFTIMDDRSSVIGRVKNSQEQLDAIESLVYGSCITEQQKASFENWIFRARLN